jgi:hypothetical protein
LNDYRSDHVSNADVVRRFEHEFKNANNLSIVDELMSEDFVHNLPYPGLPPGREGMKAVGELVTGAFRDIEVRGRSRAAGRRAGRGPHQGAWRALRHWGTKRLG